jgi:glutathione S-transferase
MAFTLYDAPQSTCSQRVRFVLNAKGLAFEERKLDLLAGDQLAPEYLALNPNGVVPTLVHDGEVVIDSSVIIEYLDEVAPAGESFTPQAPAERARMRALMRFIDEVPAAAVRVPTYNLAFLPRFAGMSEREFLAVAESKPLRKEFMLAMGRKGFPDQEMNAALNRMRRTYAGWTVDRRQRRTVPPGQATDTRRRVGDAGDRAHGRSRPRRHVGGPTRARPLVRRHPRSSGIRADLLSRLAAD